MGRMSDQESRQGAWLIAGPERTVRVARSKGRRIALVLAWVFGIFLAGPALLTPVVYVALRIGCEVPVLSTHPVPGTDWVLEERGPPCGLGGLKPYDLTARNLIDGKSVTVAANDVSVIEMRFAPGQVTLRLPNRTMIDPVAHEFGGIKVLYDYQPRDDPVDRAAYRRWVTNSEDATSKR